MIAIKLRAIVVATRKIINAWMVSCLHFVSMDDLLWALV